MFTNGVFVVGTTLLTRVRWQWEPTLTAHDPSPPLTLESPAVGDINVIVDAPAAVTLTFLVPTVTWAVAGVTATFSLAALAPTITLNVSAPTATAQWAAVAPSVALNVPGAVASVAWAALAPSVGPEIKPPVATLQAAALAPGVAIAVPATVATVALAGVAPGITINVTAVLATLTWAAEIPAIFIGAADINVIVPAPAEVQWAMPIPAVAISGGGLPVGPTTLFGRAAYYAQPYWERFKRKPLPAAEQALLAYAAQQKAIERDDREIMELM